MVVEEVATSTTVEQPGRGEAASHSDLPPNVRREVRRILDGVARRILAEEENGESLVSADSNLAVAKEEV